MGWRAMEGGRDGCKEGGDGREKRERREGVYLAMRGTPVQGKREVQEGF